MSVCPICSRQDANIHQNPKTLVYDVGCSNCGIVFLPITAMNFLQNYQEKHKLACILNERTLKGMDHIAISDDECERDFGVPTYRTSELISMFPIVISERLDRTLINLSSASKYPGAMLSFSIMENRSLFFTQTNNDDELFFLMRQLIEDELIAGRAGSPTLLTVTIKGWNKVAELQKKSSENSNQVFVAMWFDKEMDSVYENSIKKAIEVAGYIPIRIDRVEHNNKIDDQIIAEIKQSKFVVSDFTGNRGGVYFEAGYSMGLGKPVIWTIREDQLEEVHFDTRQYSHIVWKDEKELYDGLFHRIKATIQ